MHNEAYSWKIIIPSSASASRHFSACKNDNLAPSPRVEAVQVYELNIFSAPVTRLPATVQDSWLVRNPTESHVTHKVHPSQTSSLLAAWGTVALFCIKSCGGAWPFPISQSLLKKIMCRGTAGLTLAFNLHGCGGDYQIKASRTMAAPNI